jgi:D-alanyl-D-alanine dipeptidase
MKTKCQIALLTGALLVQPSYGADPRLPAGFVHLRDIDPTIIQDIRYASAANFTGRPVDGYQAGDCILLRETAEALRLVQSDLEPRGLSLKVYDCYRPVRAVKAFMRWVQQPAESRDTRFWPRTTRGDLVKLGYIAANSIHSTGAAVDVTLVLRPLVPAVNLQATNGACNAAAAAREPDKSLDMGTSFDCFDAMSNTASSEITEEQRKNRHVLVDAMSARRFKNYAREWWHFTYVGLRDLPKPKDFVINK